MKRLSLVWFFALLVMASGCSTFHGQTGEKLDWPRSEGASVTQTFVNRSAQPFFVAIDEFGADAFIQVNPGTQYSFVSKTHQMVHYRIIWFCQGCTGGLGATEEEIKFGYTGLYTGEPVVIDDLFLRGKVPQAGLVVNYWECPVVAWDSQGNQYGQLEVGQASKMAILVPGKVTFYWRSVGKNCGGAYAYQRTHHYDGSIDMLQDTPWQGKMIGWTFLIQSRR